jgi:uncharacterized RDD family membrane protein YckC
VQKNDPRLTITPESFSVAPELLGLPLATPLRRLWAMLLDLVPVAILAGAGPVIFLAFSLAIIGWRFIAARRKRRGVIAGAGSGMARVAVAVLVFVLVLRVGDLFEPGDRDAGPDPPIPGMAAEDLAAIVEQAAGPEAAGDVREAFGVAVDSTEDAAPMLTGAERDSVVLAYAAAVERGDSVSIAGLQDAAVNAIAGERFQELSDDLERSRQRQRELASRVAELDDQLEDASQPPGLRSVLFGLADDLGIGFGWGALYFTLFLAVGRGQTPGKRIAGVRVLRLDGKPMSWWYSFERFGGYFASLTTGLLGFAQILWDRNRQGLHDKIVETVVVRDNRRWGKTVKTPV